MRGRSFFVDNNIVWNDTLFSRLRALGGSIAREAHLADVFLAAIPSNPNNPLITLAACMQGAWVLSPKSFIGGAGPSVKYLRALDVKRQIWASPQFCKTFRMEWLTILELLKRFENNTRWALLPSLPAWANARALAESKGNHAQVFCLVGPGDVASAAKHSFRPDSLIAFIAHTDRSKGSIGLLNM